MKPAVTCSSLGPVFNIVVGLGYCSSFFLFIHSGILSCHAIGAIQLKDTKDSWKCLKTKPGCSSMRTVCLVLYDLGNSSSSEKLFSIQILRKCVLMGYKWQKWNADDSFLATDPRRPAPHGYLWSDTFWFLPAQELLLPAQVCKHHPCFLWLLHYLDRQQRKPGISFWALRSNVQKPLKVTVVQF